MSCASLICYWDWRESFMEQLSDLLYYMVQNIAQLKGIIFRTRTYCRCICFDGYVGTWGRMELGMRSSWVKLGLAFIEKKMSENLWRWFGHIKRRPHDAPIWRIEGWRNNEAVRGRGRPKKLWTNVTKNDIAK